MSIIRLNKELTNIIKKPPGNCSAGIVNDDLHH